MDGVRLDKWLQVARVFKTRSQATRACNLNQVKVNGVSAKPHRSLQIGDRVEAEKGDWVRILVVKELADKTLPKKEVPRLFDDETPERPKLTEIEKLMLRPPVLREKGKGAPTKKERRQLRKLRGY
jgi:ribosome-associated heat shock protein Hsp15